ncbi:uncharacterized protein LOC120000742 [Tripterygium wilfordii]|uniref:uncharacterized protein LOC120000742 n=1 Tax=Tripterygium wilfordii TaxID=458696 RepID=UPI0018F8215C|nr:uncharacterized protein LOC120000742 [Tripterygium wilfordii]
MDEAGSSSSFSSGSWTYHVFLSFRGEDTRKQFSDHLFNALDDAGINTFRDDKLKRGTEISSDLVRSIQKSRIALIVFSPGYATSGWCLEELVNIMKCRKTVRQMAMPIFYKVDRSDVKEQRGSFAEAFADYEERFVSEMDKVARWRAALTEAADLPGWDFRKDHNGHEAKFIRGIVEKVLVELDPTRLLVAENHVGLDSRLEDMRKLLDRGSNDVRVVGIYGMGGIGKTTLAKFLYNKICHHFEGKSFLADVRTNSKRPDGLVLLQKQLLSDILKIGEMMLSTKDMGISVIKERLSNIKVLIVLDDVDHFDQVHALARKGNWFGLGSRIIITTRDRHLLEKLESDGVYRVELLNETESLELFSWHAFGNAHPAEDYVQVSKTVVALSGRLPLALKVFGSYLSEIDTKEWRSVLESKTIPHDDIWKELRISYDALSDDHEKDIFLDIACYFIGMDKDYVVKILDGCGPCGFFAEIGISVLTRRCLVTINEKNKLMMHDLLRDMGREIVRKESPRFPGGRSRLWKHEEVFGALRNHTGTEVVEGLMLNMPSPNVAQCSAEAFAKMTKLRLLLVSSVCVTGSYSQISKELRWLYWSKFSLKSIPADFHMDNLIVLDMQYSSLRQVWKDNKQVLGRLRILNLSHSPYLAKTPDFLKLPNLEKLILKDCRSLAELHQSIGSLNRLILVNVKGCKSLKSIPVSICRLKSLEILNLSGCSKISEFPEDIGEIESLRELIADGTTITKIPISLVSLKNLRKFSLCLCKRTASSEWPSLIKSWGSLFIPNHPVLLPASLAGLSSLTTLCLRLIKSWGSLFIPNHPVLLPASLAGLSSLTTLCLRDCNLSDDNIPEDIGKLSQLIVLDLRGNDFCRLPESVTRFLPVDKCTRLQSLPELPKSLVELSATDCTSLKRISIVSELEQQPTLFLTNCHNLLEILGLEILNLSGRIHMEGCNNLKEAFKESLLQGCCRGENCSVFLPGKEIPSWFSHQSEGPSLSFEVPSIPPYKCKRFTIGVVFAHNVEKNESRLSSLVTLVDKTTGLDFTFRPLASAIPSIPQDHISLFQLPSNVWNQLNDGDQVEMVLDLGDGFIVKKCGLHLVFEQDESRVTQLSFTSCDFPDKRSHEDVGRSNGWCSGDQNKRSRHQTASVASMDEAGSSSSSSGSWTYDVFLSFRGEDTRKQFTDHLYYALKDAGINTFRDDEELRRGKDIAADLVQSIQKSRIALIVFSTDYAASGWCIEELVNIMKCRKTLQQMVMPIFYKVDRSDVKEQRGSFAQAFAHHEKRFASEMDKVARWRAALTEAADLPGWDLRNYHDGHEGKFIREIVEKVLVELNHSHLFVAKNPIGLDSRLQDMKLLLDLGSKDVRIVGICGMGGSGKTTLAKFLYNKIFSLFEGKSFLADVRETSKLPNGLVQLQKQLLSDILKRGEMMLSTKDLGISVIKERLSNIRALIVLDDVDHLDQIEALLGRKGNWFGIGTRIIITTRDQHLLGEHQLDGVYMVELLNETESLELFSWHAFGNAHPAEDYVQVSKTVVALSGRLPLALTVLGSYLSEIDTKEWRSVLEELKTIGHDDIWKKLRISYDALSDGHEKDIFLDIACYFIGMDKDYVVKILDGCGLFAEIGISVLTCRCLVTINEKNKLMMHDLLRDMGREIVRKESPRFPGGRSRLWQHEEVFGALRNHTGTEAVEGLMLNMPSPSVAHCSAEAFAKMTKLRLLLVSSVCVTGSYSQISKELRWLYWSKFSLKSIPADFHMDNLIVLDMQYSSLRQVWKDNKVLGSLRILNLSHSPYLATTPDFLKLPNLEKLILKDCRSLAELHQSIGSLNRLILVNVKGCKSLKSIPVSVCRLKSLEILNLSGCSKINEFPEDIGEIESLRELIADGTMIRKIPISIVSLKNLRKFSLCLCKRTASSEWPSLIKSWVSSFIPNHPVLLPASLAGLSSLTTLCLRECNLSDDSIPEDIGTLSQLIVLDLGGNDFCRLPECVTRFLAVDKCRRLQSLPELPKSLVELSATDCTLPKRISVVSKLEQQPTLFLSNCHNLLEILGLENLNLSGRIHMEGCNNLKEAFKESLLQGCCRGENCSVFLPGKEIPSWFSHQSEGPSLSFEVPSIPPYKYKRFTVGVVYAQNVEKNESRFSSLVTLVDKTTGLDFTFRPLASAIPSIPGDHISLFQLPSNVWNQLNDGDQVEMAVDLGDGFIVNKCGLHLVFEQDESGVTQLSLTSCDVPDKRSHEDVGHSNDWCSGNPNKRLRHEHGVDARLHFHDKEDME